MEVDLTQMNRSQRYTHKHRASIYERQRARYRDNEEQRLRKRQSVKAYYERSKVIKKAIIELGAMAEIGRAHV